MLWKQSWRWVKALNGGMQMNLFAWMILMAQISTLHAEGTMLLQIDTACASNTLTYVSHNTLATVRLLSADNATKAKLIRMQSPAYFTVPNAGGFDREAARLLLFKSLEVNEEQRRRLANLCQGSEEWKEARKHRLTGSNFGAAVGHNPYTTPKRLVHEMLYGSFEGNDATRWGSKHEAVACHEYTLSRRFMMTKNVGHSESEFTVTHSGLNVCAELPWLAVSPDGHVHESNSEGILEIKCPYSKKVYQAVPPHYMDQVQGIMGVLSVSWADFCVWTPDEMCIQRIHSDRRYWETHLLPALKRFYHELFVPAFIAREERRHSGDFSIPPQP